MIFAYQLITTDNNKLECKMKSQMYKKNKIATAITCALVPLLLSTSALANEDSAAKKAKKEKEAMEIIEVKSIKDSISSSLNNKRNSNSIIDAINADDIGSFPDSNVAESLQRIPGISISRSLDGSGEGVSIRGFGPGKNLSLVNGQQLTSSSFNLENGLNRGYNYGVLPSTIVHRAEVYKSSEARLPEGGVGGTVNIVTRKPLNQNEDFLFVASGSAEYNDLADNTSPVFSALSSWKVTDNFGALISIDYSDKKSRRDAVEIYSYSRPTTITTAKGDTFTDVIIPGAIGAANFNQTRERKTAMVTLQYQPSDSIDMSLNYLKSDMSGDNLNTNLITLNHQGWWPKNETAILDAKYDKELNTLTQVTYAKMDWNKAWQQPATAWVAAIYRDAILENDSFNYDLEYIGDESTVKFALGSSSSTGGAGDVNVMRTLINSEMTIGIDDGVGYAIFDNAQENDLADAVTWSHGGAKVLTMNDNKFAALDTEFYLDDGFVTSIQAGIRLVESEQERKQWSISNDYHKVTDAHDKLRGVTTISEFGEVSNTPSDLLSGIDTAGVTTYQYLDPRDMKDFGIVYTPRGHHANSFRVKENLNSAYVQANFEQEFGHDLILRGNAGLRYIDQEVETFNFSNDITHKTEEGLAALNAFAYDYVAKGNTDELLPSVNFTLDVGEEFVVRSAFSTVITRPAYAQLARPATLLPKPSDDDEEDLDNPNKLRQITRGNPDLDGFKADKYDFSAEWYYKDASSISLGVFYYDVKTFVADEFTEEDLLGDGELWLIKQPQNQDGGNVRGIELAVAHTFDTLPAPFDGLGIQANVTKLESDNKETKASDGSPLPLPGLSELTYNAVFFYSKDEWDARVSYNYRDGFYEQPFDIYSRFNDDIGRLTAKVKYKVNKNLSVFVQGTNLTDQENKRYVDDPARPMQTSHVGRNYRVGFNYKF